MQAWIVKHKREPGLFVYTNDRGVWIWTTPTVFWDLGQAEEAWSEVPSDDWQVVEVEITEK